MVNEEEEKIESMGDDSMNLVDFSNMLEKKFNIMDEVGPKFSHSFTPKTPGKIKINQNQETFNKLKELKQEQI
jgi:hypothetical protein